MFERSTVKVLRDRMNERRQFIQVLMGPRQVGKTTLINQMLRQLNKAHILETTDAVPASDALDRAGLGKRPSENETTQR